MSRLETAAKPIVLALMLGLEGIVTGPDRTTLAFWCTKTALVLDACQGKRRRAPEHVGTRELERLRRPSDGSKVYVASIGFLASGVHERWAVRDLSLSPPFVRSTERAIVITVAVRGLLFQVFVPVEPQTGGTLGSVRPHPEVPLTQVWPLHDRDLAWPPEIGFGFHHWEQVARAEYWGTPAEHLRPPSQE
jgi:hypothetical protein